MHRVHFKETQGDLGRANEGCEAFLKTALDVGCELGTDGSGDVGFGVVSVVAFLEKARGEGKGVEKHFDGNAFLHFFAAVERSYVSNELGNIRRKIKIHATRLPSIFHQVFAYLLERGRSESIVLALERPVADSGGRAKNKGE